MCSCCNKICLYNKTIYNKFIIFIILKKVSNGFERFLAVSITFCLNEKQYQTQYNVTETVSNPKMFMIYITNLHPFFTYLITIY